MDAFSDFVYNNPSLSWTGAHIGLVLLHSVPITVPSNAPPAVDDFVDAIGYQELDVAGYARDEINATAVVSGALHSIIVGADFEPGLTEESYVRAGVFYMVGTHAGIVNPWLFVTDVCFGIVMTPGARVAAIDVPPQTLFSYTVQGTKVLPAVAQVVQVPGPQEWEPSRMYHVYLYPERVNWVPNSSFEETGNFGWRASGIITRTLGGVDSAANHFGRVAGNRLESVPSSSPNGRHRVSAYVRSHGATWVQLGLSCWSVDWINHEDFLGNRKTVSDGWGLIDAVINSPDDTAGTSFLALSDGPFDIDLVLMEAISELNAYFDGDSNTSAVGDFSWQTVPHQSYSFWYNNKYLVGARVFGEYTEGQIKQPNGLVYDWIPVDSALATHWDVLSPTDTRHPLKDWASPLI